MTDNTATQGQAALPQTAAGPEAGTAQLGEPHLEWAVEVTWRDWKKSGATGPTSQFGPFETEQHRDSFLATQRRDRDVTATRVLTRLAAYTPWDAAAAPMPTSEEERQRLHEQLIDAFFERPAAADADGA